ncbi:energy transducer TonB [Labilibaculum antarcticum]|uniref:Energy transducer TonB n=1 Tax=Labilibaculum antarcticum TaxID=1717717 RepID=A0A1Y1CRK8_9BACT|nr:energy transducer TonB [Labilibaculum antarcticum]BAX81881.1 energy transducer TonB [Labilibaculum antarcticum]
MIPKKNPNADLEKRKSLFFEIGLVVALALTLISFEWPTRVREVVEIRNLVDLKLDEEIIPITRQEEIKEKPKLPPKIHLTDVITIVEDDTELENELEIVEDDFNQETEFEIAPQEVFVEEEVDEEMKIFVIVEEMPIFRPDICKNNVEGNLELYRHINSSIRYPVIAQENGITGRVYVSFVVGKDGSISKVELLRGVDPSLDQEALRVIRNLPKFEPGKQRGKPVKVSYSTVINFVLQ